MKGGVRYREGAQVEWDRRAANSKAARTLDVPFQYQLETYLPHDPQLTCLEIGAIPGRFLAYLAQHHGYRVVGLDFATAEDLFQATMHLNGVTDYEFIYTDFREYRTRRRFDVVTSFGFVEHFDDWEAVVEAQCGLVADSGYVVISVPNFRYIQYAYQRVVDPENLEIHNLACMDQARLDSLLRTLGFEHVFNGFLGGLEFWWEHPPKRVAVRAADLALRKVANYVGRFLPNSRLYSPYLLAIYRHRGLRNGRFEAATTP